MKIYLAGPYSHDDPDVRASRFETLNMIAAMLMKNGHLVFSPISHTHPIAMAGDLPLGFDFWEAYDRTFIEWCDEVWVAPLSGYDTSKGVQQEIAIAQTLKKPVRYYGATTTQSPVNL